MRKLIALLTIASASVACLAHETPNCSVVTAVHPEDTVIAPPPLARSKVAKTIRIIDVPVAPGLYKQTRYTPGDEPEQEFPYCVYKKVTPNEVTQIDILNFNMVGVDLPLYFIAKPIVIEEKDVLSKSKDRFDYRWVCDMSDHKTIPYGTVVKEHYDTKFEGSKELSRIFRGIAATVKPDDYKLQGVWHCISDSTYEFYKIYAKKYCYHIAVYRDMEQRIRSIRGIVRPVKYTKDGNTMEDDSLCKIGWLTPTQYLERDSVGENGKLWERSELPARVSNWFK